MKESLPFSSNFASVTALIIDGEVNRRLSSIFHFKELDPGSFERLAHNDFAVWLCHP